MSRGLQSTLGLLTGTVVYGVAMGGVFALVFAAVYGRIGHARARGSPPATLALVAFTVIVLVPFLKYPSNPPAVGNDDTIGYRTQIYFVMIGYQRRRRGRRAARRPGHRQALRRLERRARSRSPRYIVLVASSAGC